MGAGGATNSVVGIQDLETGQRVNVVERGDGKKALAIDGTVQIEQLFGRDNIADTWFYIGTSDDVCDGVGAENDTVRVQIVAGCDAVLHSAVDVTTTVSAAVIADPSPAVALSELIADDLNADADFNKSWVAQHIGDNGIVHVSAIDDFYGEVGERTTLGDFTASSTGTTVVSAAFTTIERRGKSTELARNPNDPRVGVLGISGSIRIRADGVDALLSEKAMNGGNEDLAVDGSVTPVVFSVLANTASQANKFIEAMKIYGEDGNIKVGEGNFLGNNSPLINGIKVDITQNGITTTLPLIKSTNDLLARFSTKPSDSEIIGQSGGDYIISQFDLVSRNIAIELESGTTDKIEVTVQDNLTSINSLFFVVDGFLED